MTRDTVERPRRGQTPATGPRTGQVRIIGAERAADAAAPPNGTEEAGGRDGAPAPSHARPEPDPLADGGEGNPRPGAADQEPVDRDAGDRDAGDRTASHAETGDAPSGGPATGSPGPQHADTESWGSESWDTEDWGAQDWATQEREVDLPTDEPTSWMPHWTEAPTGEVPAVLARDDEVARAARREPSWREDPNDWELDASLARPILEDEGDDVIGAADDVDRQPWTFELDTGVDAEPRAEVGSSEPERTERVAPDELGGADDLADAGAPAPYSPWTPTGEHPAVRGPEPGGAPATGAANGGGRDEPTTRVDQVRAGPGREDRDGAPGDAAGTEAAGRAAGAHGSRGLAGEEAAALAEDLEAHGLRRMWERRRPETVRGGTARHRARSAATPVDEEAGSPQRGDAPSRTGRNIPVAIGSGVAIGALVLVAFYFGTVPAMVVVTAVIVLAAAEAYGALRRGGQRPATLLGLAAVLALLIGTYDRVFQAMPVVLVLLVVGTFLWHLVKIDAKADPLRSTAVTLLVFCWVGVFGSFAALLLAPSLFPDRHGIAYLLGALISAAAYDVGALAVGAWIGRHPLTTVSPGKTWEGVIGGGVVAIAVAVAVVRLIHPWTLAETVALGVVVAVVSPLGDLSESLVKRHLGVKDMGRILPGHGGILDRIDGMLFVLPATYYLLRAFGHG